MAIQRVMNLLPMVIATSSAVAQLSVLGSTWRSEDDKIVT